MLVVSHDILAALYYILVQIHFFTYLFTVRAISESAYHCRFEFAPFPLLDSVHAH